MWAHRSTQGVPLPAGFSPGTCGAGLGAAGCTRAPGAVGCTARSASEPRARLRDALSGRIPQWSGAGLCDSTLCCQVSFQRLVWKNSGTRSSLQIFALTSTKVERPTGQKPNSCLTFSLLPLALQPRQDPGEDAVSTWWGRRCGAGVRARPLAVHRGGFSGRALALATLKLLSLQGAQLVALAKL